MNSQEVQAKRRDKWQAHILRHEQSSMSLQRYCQENNLTMSSFYLWRSKLKAQANGKKIAPLVKIKSKSAFLPVEVMRSEETESNISRLNSLPDPEWLAQLILAAVGGAR